MVLISVNTVLRLLKWSTCVRGRTHLVVVAIDTLINTVTKDYMHLVKQSKIHKSVRN